MRRVVAQPKERDGSIAADVEQFALSIGEESTDEDDAGQHSDEQSSGSESDSIDTNEEESDGWETESSANSDDGQNHVKRSIEPVAQKPPTLKVGPKRRQRFTASRDPDVDDSVHLNRSTKAGGAQRRRLANKRRTKRQALHTR